MGRFIMRVARWVRSWRDMRKCDQCSGRFTWGHIHPASGDVWLCTDCIEKYMRGEI